MGSTCAHRILQLKPQFVYQQPSCAIAILAKLKQLPLQIVIQNVCNTSLYHIAHC